MASLDPEYVSGGRGAEGLEKKVVAVFEKEFGLAIQQVGCPGCHPPGGCHHGQKIRDTIRLVLMVNLRQKEEELAVIDERILEVRRSVLGLPVHASQTSE